MTEYAMLHLGSSRWRSKQWQKGGEEDAEQSEEDSSQSSEDEQMEHQEGLGSTHDQSQAANAIAEQQSKDGMGGDHKQADKPHKSSRPHMSTEVDSGGIGVTKHLDKRKRSDNEIEVNKLPIKVIRLSYEAA